MIGAQLRWDFKLAVAATGIVFLALLGLATQVGLNADVRYVLGGLGTAADTPAAIVDTFVHRPLAYRVAVAPLAALHEWLSGSITELRLHEAILKLVTVPIIGAAAVGTWLGLRHRFGSSGAAAVGFAIGSALAFAPAWDYLQAEWLAGACLVLALPAAVGPRRAAVAGAAGGILVVAAFAAKLATAPLSVAALLLIAVVSVRRALAATAGAMAWGVCWLAVVAALPQEQMWLADMAALNPNSLLRSAFEWEDAVSALKVVTAKLVLHPHVLVLPASIVLLGRMRPSMRETVFTIGAGFLIVSLSVAPLVLQGQWFLYHLAALPLVAAAIIGLTVAQLARHDARPVAALLFVVALGAVGSTVILSMPASWRETNESGVAAGLLLSILLVTVWSVTVQLDRDARVFERWRSFSAVGMAFLLAALPASAPGAAWSLGQELGGPTAPPPNVATTNSSWPRESAAKHDVLRALSEQLGRSTAVLYLAYGDVSYHMGNPTDCPYPSPLWLQKAAYDPDVSRFASYRDSLKCLRRTAAAYALLQPGWLELHRLDQSVTRDFEALFSCGDPFPQSSLLICPRRSDAPG